MTIDNNLAKLSEDLDVKSTKYDNMTDAFAGVATTVGGAISGAVGATLGLPTDLVGIISGLKDAATAEDGKRLDAFADGFTEFSKENLGSQYYKDVFNKFVDSLDVDDVLKNDAKAGFSAGEFVTPPIAGGGAVKAVSKIDKIKDAFSRAESMAMKAKDNAKRKVDELRDEFNTKAPQTYTRSEIMAMTAKREPSPVRQMTEAEKRAQEFDFEKSFDLPIAKARGQMEMGIQKIAERIKNVSANIEKTGYYDAYPKGSKFVGPRSGKEYTVIGYSVSPVNPKGKDTLTKLHNKRKELIESGVMPKELTFFDGNNPKFSANVDEYDDKFYRPMLVVKDKDGKTERFNYDILLHQDERKKELLNKVMPTSNAPKVNILDSTKEGEKQKSGLMSMTTKREPSPVREMTKLEQVISDVPKADADKLDDIDLYKFMDNFESKYDDFDLALEQSKLPKEQLNKAEIDFGNRMSNIDKIYTKRREKNLAKYKELDKHAESADYEFREAMDAAYDNAADTVDETAEEIFGRTMSKEELSPIKERGNLIFDNYFFSSLDSMLADRDLTEDYNFVRNLDKTIDKNSGGLMARN